MNKKIVISGWYGPGNIGDEAILQAIIDILEAQYPNCSITALSYNPKYTKKTQLIHAVRQVPSSKKGWLRSIVTLDIFKTIKAIKECDIFIMGGGGFLSDWQPNVPRDWLKQMKIAKYFSKETWLYGIGAGPFLTDEGRKTVKYYLENFVDKITVRDRESFNQLVNNVKISNKVNIAIDPVALMNVRKYIKTNNCKDNSISLIFTEYFNNKNFKDDQSYKWELLFEAFCAQVDAVIDYGKTPKLIFFQKNIEENLAKKFLMIYGEKIQIEFPADYKDAISLLDKSDAVISFRLHGNILAYALKKPFLPTIYHHKTAGFLEHINYLFKDLILEVGDGVNWKDKNIDKKIWYRNTLSFLEKI